MLGLHTPGLVNWPCPEGARAPAVPTAPGGVPGTGWGEGSTGSKPAGGGVRGHPMHCPPRKKSPHCKEQLRRTQCPAHPTTDSPVLCLLPLRIP